LVGLDWVKVNAHVAVAVVVEPEGEAASGWEPQRGVGTPICLKVTFPEGKGPPELAFTVAVKVTS
jgi:hypothetical protein